MSLWYVGSVHLLELKVLFIYWTWQELIGNHLYGYDSCVVAEMWWDPYNYYQIVYWAITPRQHFHTCRCRRSRPQQIKRDLVTYYLLVSKWHENVHAGRKRDLSLTSSESGKKFILVRGKMSNMGPITYFIATSLLALIILFSRQSHSLVGYIPELTFLIQFLKNQLILVNLTCWWDGKYV